MCLSTVEGKKRVKTRWHVRESRAQGPNHRVCCFFW
jgi:hypothetical protein